MVSLLLTREMDAVRTKEWKLLYRDLRVYSSASTMLGEGTLRYYKDDFQLEVDAIIHGNLGSSAEKYAKVYGHRFEPI